MIPEALIVTSTWLLNNTGSYLYSLILNSPYKKILRNIDKKQLNQILEDYNHRFEKQLFMVSQDEELDVQGLKEYTKKELLEGFVDSLLASTYSTRKEKRRRLQEGAYEAGHAVKAGQKKKVQIYIETIFRFGDTFTEQKLSVEQIMQNHILEDSLMERIRLVDMNLRNELVRLGEGLTDRNSFSNMIDQIQPKGESKNTFHYLNNAIGFWGREEEIKVLEDFLEDERPVLYTAVVAPGGCGKSKLVYEFVKQNRYNTDWEMQYLDGAQIRRLLDFSDYCYPRNLVLIVDYAGLYAEILGKWLKHLLTIKDSARPAKIRLILLEREGKVIFEKLVITPSWKKSMESSGEQKKLLQKIMYTKAPFSGIGELRPLDDASIKKMIMQHGKNQKRPLTEAEVEALLAHLNQMGHQGILRAKPLLALFITQAYISGQSIFTWNTQDMMDHFLERFNKQYEYLCKKDENIFEAVKRLVFYATAMGPINLDNENTECLKNDVEVIEKLPDEQYMALLCGINQESTFRNVIMPMEPDILGEYFVLHKLQTMTALKKKMKKILSEFWKKPEQCFTFLARCIKDYGDRREFADFFINEIDILLPEANSKVKAEAESRLLHLMLITLRGKDREAVIAERMRHLYEANPKYQHVAEDYAASLMLEYKNHFGDFPAQDENVEKINKLRKKFPSSEYLDMIYGKSLYNQIVSYHSIYDRQSTPKARSDCAKMIEQNMKKLGMLCKERPGNPQVRRSYEMARVLLNAGRVVR